jgi:PKD repeat protein
MLFGGAVIAAQPQTGAAAPRPEAVDVPGLAVVPVLQAIPGSPTAVRFMADGRIYVATVDGRVLMYDRAGDTSPVTALDLRTQVQTLKDLGMLGIAFDPAFTTGRPYMYVLYDYDRDPFGATTVPRWGDQCPNPPGETVDGCTVSARLDRFTIGASGVAVTSSVKHLLDGVGGADGGWCSQFSAHSIGTVQFGTDGMLYVGAGDGASYNFSDFGARGGSPGSPTPPDPCNDKQGTVPRTGGRGTPLVASTSRGGALRAQAVRNAIASDYVSWDGAILRIDPNTGSAAPGNPLLANGIPGDDRIVAYGLRNPYRFVIRPGTNDLWVGDVGWGTSEEIDKFTTGPRQTTVPNFGWPCYEGVGRVGSFEQLGTALCSSLYGAPNGQTTVGGVVSPLIKPVYQWQRVGQSGALPCSTTAGGGAAVGGSFISDDSWPSALRGAYIFGDYSRGCLMAMPLGASGQPDPAQVTSIATDVSPVDIQIGPGGDPYFVDIVKAEVDRVTPTNTNLPPNAAYTVTPGAGVTPLTVAFDASSTSDPNAGDTLTYAWDLDGNGSCNDATGIKTRYTYSQAGTVTTKLCVSDQHGATATVTHPVQVGNSPPTITSLATTVGPSGWKVGDTVSFTAAATDDGGPLPASAFTWTQVLRHCDSETGPTCHLHLMSSIPSGRTGSIVMPDHEYYAYIQLTLTVTDAKGLSVSRTIDLRPQIVNVAVDTSPEGIPVSIGSSTHASPFSTPFLAKSSAQLTVPDVATVNGTDARFVGWTDNPTAGHIRSITATAQAPTFVALYDVAAPQISSLTADPPTVDVGSPAQVAIAARLTDDTGMASANVRLVGAGGAVVTAPLQLVNGSATDATWSAAVSLPAIATAGNWSVVVTAVDRVGRTVQVVGPAVPVQAVGSLGPPPVPGGVTSVSPNRLLDTRIGTGAPIGRLRAGTTLRLQVAGTPDVPPGTSAILMNLTAVDAAGPGYVTAFPCGDVPFVSNVNVGGIDAVPNLATVALDAQGGVCFTASVDVDLVADLAGTINPQSHGTYAGITPTRVVDTRIGVGFGPLAGGQIVHVPLGSAGIPADAVAVAATVTVTNPQAAGYITVFPCSTTPPLASNVNYVSGQTVSNLAVTALNPARELCVTSSQATDLVIDISGWITPSPSGTSGHVQPTTPSRVMDTRLTGHRLSAGETFRLDTSVLHAPVNAIGIVANFTVADPALDGYITVFPCAAALPLASNVNFAAHEDRSTLSAIGFGAGPAVCVYSHVPLDLVVDVQGWITG